MPANFTANSGSTKVSTKSFGNNSESTYYDETGTILGYSHSFSDGNFSGTSYENANREWLGHKNVDNGTGWSSSVIVTTNATTGVRTETGTDTQYAVVNGSVTTNVEWSRSFVYNFDSDGNFTGGTETDNGIQRTFDANWNVTSEAASSSFIAGLSAVSSSDLALLPANFTANSGSTKVSTKSFGNNSESTYYDETGTILGYTFSHSEGSSTGISYEDADRNWLGNKHVDGETGWESSILITRNQNGSYVENGTNTQYAVVNGSVTTNVEWSRSFVYNFDSDGNFTGGTETDNGIQRTFDANWNVTSEAASSSFIAGLSAVSSSDLALLPANFTANSGSTKVSTKSFGNNSESTYYDETGTILGYSHSFSDGNFSGTSYENANREWIGHKNTDLANGRSDSMSVSTNTASGVRTEHSIEIKYLMVNGAQDSSAVEVVRTRILQFTSNEALISAIEAENANVRVFGSNWAIIAEGQSSFTQKDSNNTADAGDIFRIKFNSAVASENLSAISELFTNNSIFGATATPASTSWSNSNQTLEVTLGLGEIFSGRAHDLLESEPDNVITAYDTTSGLVANETYAIIQDGSTFTAVKGSWASGTFSPGDGTGDVTGLDASAVQAIYDAGAVELGKYEPEPEPDNVITAYDTTSGLVANETYAIIQDGSTFTAVKGSWASATFSPGDGTGDVTGLDSSAVQAIYDAGAVELGNYEPPVEGTVIDGYISGAKVFADEDFDLVHDWTDANSNSVWDPGEGEPWVRTNFQGDYNFSTNVLDAPLIAVGGTDTSTGEAFTGALSALPGGSVITPLTTIISQSVLNDVEDLLSSFSLVSGSWTDLDGSLSSLDDAKTYLLIGESGSYKAIAGTFSGLSFTPETGAEITLSDNEVQLIQSSNAVVRGEPGDVEILNSVSTAVSKVATAFGLSGGVDFLHYDPIEVLNDGDASQAQKDVALSVQKASAAIANVLVTAGGAGSTESSYLSNASEVVANIVDKIDALSGSAIDLSNQTVLSEVIGDLATSQEIASLASSNASVDVASDIAQVTTAQAAVQKAASAQPDNVITIGSSAVGGLAANTTYAILSDGDGSFTAYAGSWSSANGGTFTEATGTSGDVSLADEAAVEAVYATNPTQLGKYEHEPDNDYDWLGSRRFGREHDLRYSF